ncbi:MAG: hypothetical protein V4508_08870 [Pseudomonadota bacterium]
MTGLKQVARAQAAARGGDPNEGKQLKEQLKRAASDGLKWTFAFRFFRQIEFFGLDAGKIDAAWMVSVVERLRDMGEQDIDSVLRNGAEADAYRFHPIKWTQKNIPVQHSDLHWLLPDYLGNPSEFPIFQFMVSKGKGRIIGFFDENCVFQIVLLDPLHNMQPSKDFGYAVDDCSPLACEFTRLHDSVATAIGGAPECECGVAAVVQAVLATNGYGDKYSVILMRVDDPTYLEDAEDLISTGVAKSHTEIFQAGLDFLTDRAPRDCPAGNSSDGAGAA